MKVTVFTTVYNGLPFLKEAIESTLNQTYKDYEYLIIDDCSDDESVSVIESYDDSRIRLVKNNKNLGTANTINKALSLINTKYAVRLDQDDISLPNRIDEQISFLEKNPNIDILCSWEHTIDSNGVRGIDWKGKLDNYGEFLAPIALGMCPIWHPSIAFRTKAMVDVGGFKAEYVRSEDFEVTARLALKRYSAAIIPKFHLLYRNHSQSQSKEFEKEQKIMSEKIQKEILEKFVDKEEAIRLSSFLRFKNFMDIKFDKNYLLQNRQSLELLFTSVAKKQKLNNDELKSFKQVIFSRIGLGVLLMKGYKFLPNSIFMFVFYMLSPRYSKFINRSLSILYNSFQNLRYKLIIPKN